MPVTLQTITLISSLLGAMGAVSIILAYIVSQRFRASVIARLALSISVADMLASIAYGSTTHFYDNDYLCQLQGFVQVLTETTSTLLVLCIALNLIFVVRAQATFADVRSYDSLYIPVAWMIGVAFASIPLLVPQRNWYGPMGDVWCFLTPNGNVILQIMYGTLFVVFAFGLVAVVMVKVVEKNKNEEHILERFRVEDERLVLLPGIISLYLVAFLLAWSPMIVVYVLKRMFRVIDINNNPIVSLLIVVCLPLRGFLNAMVGLYQAWAGDHAHAIALQRKQIRLSRW